jgi:PKD repeat protein
MDNPKQIESSEPTVTPTACFKTSSCFLKSGETVSFTNCSENLRKVKWDFGDGTGSDLFSPAHVFSRKGFYKVKLTAYYKNRSVTSDTTIACDMSAFVRVTLKFSWHMNQEVNSHPYTFDIGSVLHTRSKPNNIGNLLYHGYMYANTPGSYLDSLVLKVPVADASEEYFLNTQINGIYPMPNSSPSSDTYHQENFGAAITKDFDLFSMPRLKGVNELEIVTINYSVSSAVFE